MKKNLALKLAAAAAGAVLSTGAMADIDLTGIGWVQYGDAQSYSLPIACIQAGFGPTSQSCPFFIQSSPGQIKDLTVVGTGAGGQDVNTNFPGMDNAYPTPSGNGILRAGQNFMQTGGLTFGGQTYTAPDPGGANQFVGDKANTWDTTLGALKGFLGNSQMVIFFNNNQDNSLGTAAQSLAAWAQVEVTGPGGVRLGIYDFTNMHGHYNLVSQGGGGVFLGDVHTYTSLGLGPSGNSNASTDYVLSGGQICVRTDLGPIPVPVPCGSLNASAPINHNLGANQAAYAIVFPELNQLLAGLFALPDLTGYSLHADFRIGCDPTLFGTNPDATICNGSDIGWGKNLTNGYEQIFISTLAAPTLLAEPSALWLLGFGLLGLGWMGRRSGRRV